jgi:hypothetical protein
MVCCLFECILTWNSSTNHIRGQKGNPASGGITGHPVTEGHKYRDLVLQVGDSIQGWWPCSVKKSLLQIPKIWKPGETDKSADFSMAMAQKGLFCQWLAAVEVVVLCWRWMFRGCICLHGYSLAIMISNVQYEYIKIESKQPKRVSSVWIFINYNVLIKQTFTVHSLINF